MQLPVLQMWTLLLLLDMLLLLDLLLQPLASFMVRLGMGLRPVGQQRSLLHMHLLQGHLLLLLEQLLLMDLASEPVLDVLAVLSFLW